MGKLDRCYNIADLRDAAQRRLPKGIFEYVDRGTEDEIALANNRSAYDEIKLLNRALVDISDIRTETNILGNPSALPLAIAPTGAAGLCWFEGELELAKAAAKAGIPFSLATPSNTAMEKIAKEAGGRLWFQLYMWRDKELSDELVKRAARAGFETLIWTVDSGHGFNREYNARNGFATPYKLNARSMIDAITHPEWLTSVLGRYVATSGMPRHVNYPEKYQDKITGNISARAPHAHKLGWEDVDRLRAIWPGKLVIKGIMRVEDAKEAACRGVDGIVVSNHGGRNMDSAPSPLEVLPGIAAAVRGRTTIIVDSGVRRGSDIVKALALGADCVLAGRATLYGVSAAGQLGAEKALSILDTEMRKTMAYIGRQRIDDISRDDLWQSRSEARAEVPH
jgi:isopentenyl diphosphate isomerase/L-lactate dehydrogenase-like FMN-dependent dehydrogenase